MSIVIDLDREFAKFYVTGEQNNAVHQTKKTEPDNTLEITSGFGLVTQFSTISQNEKSIKSTRFLCPLFTLLTAYHFMNTNVINKLQHEKIIVVCDNIINNTKIPFSASFDDIIALSKMQNMDSKAMLNNEIDYKLLFPQENNKYCVIILKQGKYFIVAFDGATYCVRDCHMDEQYNFCDYRDLIMHLENNYNLGETMEDDFCTECEVIEYLIIDDKFELSDHLSKLCHTIE